MISSVLLSVALSTVGFGHHHGGEATYASAQCPTVPGKHCPTPQAPCKALPTPVAPAKHCPTPQAPCKSMPVVPSKQVVAAPQAPLKASPQY